MKELDNIQKLLIVSPSSLINKFNKDFFDKKREDGYYVLAFSSSILHMRNINFVPDGWSFIDPSTLVNCINNEMLQFIQNKVDLIILDLYHNNGENFVKNNLTSKHHPLNKNNLHNFTKFKNIFSKKNSKVIEIGSNSNVESLIDWTEHLSLYIGDKIKKNKKNSSIREKNTRYNIDKLACFLLPMVVHYMRNLNEIAALCFWDFNSDRLHSPGVKNQSNGYNHYLRSIKMMAPEIKENLLQSKIDFVNIGGQQLI